MRIEEYRKKSGGAYRDSWNFLIWEVGVTGLGNHFFIVLWIYQVSTPISDSQAFIDKRIIEINASILSICL